MDKPIEYDARARQKMEEAITKEVTVEVEPDQAGARQGGESTPEPDALGGALWIHADAEVPGAAEGEEASAGADESAG